METGCPSPASALGANRTRDLPLRRRSLYPLSYQGELLQCTAEGSERAGIEATLRLGLTNARIEEVNTTLRLICRRAYGFHSARALIALAMLPDGGLRPHLPGRT